MEYNLTKEMKDDLLAKTTVGSNVYPACDAEQIDWNLFILHYPDGTTQLRNLLFWDAYLDFQPDPKSYKKLEYGVFLIRDIRGGDYLIDTRSMNWMVNDDIECYEKLSQDIYLVKHFMGYSFYNLQWVFRKDIDNSAFSFKNYRKLSEVFYLLDKGTEDMCLYNIKLNWCYKIKECQLLTETMCLIELELPEKKSYFGKYYVVTENDAPDKLKYRNLYHAYTRLSRLLIIKNNGWNTCLFFDCKTGRKGIPQEVGEFVYESYKEEEDHVRFISANGSFCDIFYDTLEFTRWQFV